MSRSTFSAKTLLCAPAVSVGAILSAIDASITLQIEDTCLSAYVAEALVRPCPINFTAITAVAPDFDLQVKVFTVRFFVLLDAIGAENSIDIVLLSRGTAGNTIGEKLSAGILKNKVFEFQQLTSGALATRVLAEPLLCVLNE